MPGGPTLALVILLVAASPAGAQQAEPFPLALDTVAAVDEAVDERGNFATGVTLDAVAAIGLGAGFEAFARPFVQRLTSGEWNRQVWVAAVRYQRPGPVALRVEAGLIPSPVGLANMTLRPHQVPTISQPASLFLALPPVELRAPRTTVLGVLYPYGATVTASTNWWDFRVAVIDTSPLRTRRIFAVTNPPRFTNVVVGGGITPVVGLRLGTSVTHGGWLRAGEQPQITADRDATIITVEGEYSAGYTRVVGEFVRDSLEMAVGGHTTVTGWWLQGQHTLSPRWFAAGRVERVDAPAATPLGSFEDQHFIGAEETIGFRLTPEITLRAGHRARRPFGRTGFDNQLAVSAVWWRRWF